MDLNINELVGTGEEDVEFESALPEPIVLTPKKQEKILSKAERLKKTVTQEDLIGEESKKIDWWEGFKNIKDTYLNEVSEGMKEMKSSGAIGKVLGAMKYLYAPITALARGALAKPVEDTLVNAGVNKGAAKLVADTIEMGAYFLPVGGAIKAGAQKLVAKEIPKQFWKNEGLAKEAGAVMKAATEKMPAKVKVEEVVKAAEKFTPASLPKGVADDLINDLANTIKDNKWDRLGKHVDELVEQYGKAAVEHHINPLNASGHVAKKLGLKVRDGLETMRRVEPVMKKQIFPILDKSRVHKSIINENVQQQVARSFTNVAAANPNKRIGQQIVEAITDPYFNWEEIPEIAGKYGLSPTELANELHTAYSTAGRTLARLSVAAKKMNSKYGGELTTALKELGVQPTWYDKAWMKLKGLENTRRGLLVTQAATAWRNFWSQAGRATIGEVDDMLTHVLTKAFGGAKEESWARHAGFLGTLLKRIKPSNRKALDTLLDANVGFRDKLLTAPMEEVTLGQGLTKALGWMNRCQEFIFRKAAVEYKLKNLFKVDDVAKITPEMLAKGADKLDNALTYALKSTFAESPGSGKAWAQTIKWWSGNPLMTAIINPFPRFMYNSVKFMMEYNPLHPAYKLGKKLMGKEVPVQELASSISKGMIGAFNIAMAGQIREKFGGAKWYQINVGDRVWDIRAFAPLSTYFLQYELLAHPDRINPTRDVMSAVVGLSRSFGTIGVISSQGADLDQWREGLKKIAEDWSGGFAVPWQQLKDLSTMWDPEEAVVRETRKQGLGASYISKVPGYNQSLPAKWDPIRGERVEIEYPILRQMTGISLKDRNIIEEEGERLLGDNFWRTKYPNTGNPQVDQWINKETAKLIRQEMLPFIKSKAYLELSEKTKAWAFNEAFKEVRSKGRRNAEMEHPQEFLEMKLERKPQLEREMKKEVLLK